MSKSVIIIDTPSSCRECQLRYDSYGQCEVCILLDDDIERFYITNTKPSYCPLSYLPNEIKLNQYADNTAYNTYSLLMSHYAKGWNEYREEILKGRKYD